MHTFNFFIIDQIAIHNSILLTGLLIAVEVFFAHYGGFTYAHVVHSYVIEFELMAQISIQFELIVGYILENDEYCRNSVQYQ